MQPLNKITSTIPAARREAIRRLVNDAIKRGEILSNRDAILELDKLTAEVTGVSVDSILKVRKAIEGEVIKSECWNRMQQEIFIDLHSLYDQTRNVNNLAGKHSEINRSELRKSKSAIIKAINDIRQYQFLKQFTAYQDVKYIDFNDARNLSTRRPLANIDARVRKLELSPRRRSRLQQQNVNLSSTKVTARNIGGGVSGGFDESFSPEKMLDDNPDTFWAELIFTDGRVQHRYIPSSDAGLGPNFISNGLVGEVELRLSNTQLVNNISLLPFAKYPVRVVDLAYKESVYASTWIIVPTFAVAEPSLDWYEWSFSPINVAVLKVALEQVNFTSNIFHIPESVIHNQALWGQILNKKFDQSIHDVQLTEVESGKIAAEPEFLAYLNALSLVTDELKRFSFNNSRSSDHYDVVTNLIKASGGILSKIDPNNINNVLTPLGRDKVIVQTNPKIVEVRKNEFIYGIRSIELANTKYQPISYYDSPKFVSSATILEVSLETTEEHPQFTDGLSNYQKTSVEYDLEIGENTRIPILPASSNTVSSPTGIASYKVQDEFIQIDRVNNRGFTRFSPTSISVIVRKNGTRVAFSDYTFAIDPVTNKGQLNIVSNYDANSVYTISYYATTASAVVDINSGFDSVDLINPDKFTATTRNNSLKLSYFPYVEYEIVNNTGQWIRDDSEDARWRFSPTRQNYRAGTVSVDTGSINITGAGTAWNNTNNIDTSAGIINVFRVKNDTTTYKIQSIISDTELVLEAAYGGTDNVSGEEYQIGQAFEADGRSFALDNMVYEPIRVFVNDIKAFNLTDYRTLEHPAFTPVNRLSRQYQFIHAGQNLFFNTPIKNANIEVFYSWLTQYMQVKSTLRCNIPVRTTITPKVDNLTIRIKNSKL